MKHTVWLLLALLIILHQDFWNWDSGQIVLGFIPIGLFYHVCLSLAAAAVWFIACTLAWPKGIDDFDGPTSEKGGDA